MLEECHTLSHLGWEGKEYVECQFASPLSLLFVASSVRLACPQLQPLTGLSSLCASSPLAESGAPHIPVQPAGWRFGGNGRILRGASALEVGLWFPSDCSPSHSPTGKATAPFVLSRRDPKVSHKQKNDGSSPLTGQGKREIDQGRIEGGEISRNFLI